MALQQPWWRIFGAWQQQNRCFWLIVAAVSIWALARYGYQGYMASTEWQQEPVYNPGQAGVAQVGDTLLPVPSYTYAMVQRAVPNTPQLSAWPALLYGFGFLGCFSLFVACLSFLGTFSLADRIRFYVAVGLVAGFAAFLVSDAAIGTAEVGSAFRLGVVLLNAGLLYAFNQLWPGQSLQRRSLWLALGNWVWFGAMYAFGGWPAYTLWAGYSAPVALVLACLLAFQLAYFVPYGALQLAVRQNTNGLFAFLLVLLLVVGNVLLAYLHSVGLYRGALFTPDALWVLALLALVGLEPYATFVQEESNWFTQPALAKPLLAGWAGMAFCFLAWTFATENAPLYEVVEDATNLSIVGVSVGFLVYVLVNFGVPLARSQRVDRVLFTPYQLPFSAIMATGATVITLFVLNNNNFPFFQAKAGMYNAVADGHLLQQDLQGADLFYQESTHHERYNFHANYMLAFLATAKGADALAEEYLKTAVYTKPRAEAYLALAERHRAQGVFIEQALALTEGRAQFPKDDRLAANLLITYLGSNLADSVTKLGHGLVAMRAGVPAMSNLLAAAALGRLGTDVPLPTEGPLANRLLAGADRPEPCALVLPQLDTTRLQRMASFLGLYNALMLCQAPRVTYKKLDSLIAGASEGYAEDLRYAKAWAFWRNGNRLDALDEIRPLCDKGSLSAPTYFATAIAWATEAGNPQLAADLYRQAPATLDSAWNPARRNLRWQGVPYAQVPEPSRIAWLYANPGYLTAEQVGNLLADFANPAQQRAFLLAALRSAKAQPPYMYLAAGLPRLSPAKGNKAAETLNKALAYAYAEALLEAGIALKPQLAGPWLGYLGDVALVLEALQTGKAGPKDVANAVRVYPYSATVLNLCLRQAAETPEITQKVFEIVAQAYASDPALPAPRQAYIALARTLKLDYFADEAEARAREEGLTP